MSMLLSVYEAGNAPGAATSPPPAGNPAPAADAARANDKLAFAASWAMVLDRRYGKAKEGNTDTAEQTGIRG